MTRRFRYLAIVVTLQACAQQATPNLPAALQGIEKFRFLACSGPPILEMPQGDQDRMSFITNLKRGEAVGIASPTADPTESCSVSAVFDHDRLISSQFSGNMSMCSLVFSPCLAK